MIAYLLRLGIVRVLSVPLAMTAIMYGLWVLAAPPDDLGDENGDSGTR
ncbi:MAG: hypothetical protein ACLQU2_27565 [Candidatus Binataceae bacterium]